MDLSPESLARLNTREAVERVFIAKLLEGESIGAGGVREITQHGSQTTINDELKNSRIQLAEHWMQTRHIEGFPDDIALPLAQAMRALLAWANQEVDVQVKLKTAIYLADLKDAQHKIQSMDADLLRLGNANVRLTDQIAAADATIESLNGAKTELEQRLQNAEQAMVAERALSKQKEEFHKSEMYYFRDSNATALRKEQDLTSELRIELGTARAKEDENSKRIEQQQKKVETLTEQLAEMRAARATVEATLKATNEQLTSLRAELKEATQAASASATNVQLLAKELEQLKSQSAKDTQLAADQAAERLAAANALFAQERDALLKQIDQLNRQSSSVRDAKSE